MDIYCEHPVYPKFFTIERQILFFFKRKGTSRYNKMKNNVLKDNINKVIWQNNVDLAK